MQKARGHPTTQTLRLILRSVEAVHRKLAQAAVSLAAAARSSRAACSPEYASVIDQLAGSVLCVDFIAPGSVVCYALLQIGAIAEIKVIPALLIVQNIKLVHRFA